MEKKFVVGGMEHVVNAPSERAWSLRGELFAWITVDGMKRGVELIESGPHHLDLIVDGKRRGASRRTRRERRQVWVSAGGRARLVAEVRQEKTSRRGRRSSRGAYTKGHSELSGDCGEGDGRSWRRGVSRAGSRRRLGDEDGDDSDGASCWTSSVRSMPSRAPLSAQGMSSSSWILVTRHGRREPMGDEADVLYEVRERAGVVDDQPRGAAERASGSHCRGAA